MTFAEAVEALRAGKRVRREGWRDDDLPGHRLELINCVIMICCPFVDPIPWFADEDDRLATDWEVCDD